MITCYMLTGLSVVMLALAGLQGYFQFSILNANHPTFALLTVIIYLFTESLIIFYFVGIGVSIRDYTKEKQLPGDFHKRSIAVKRRIYPPILLNMLLVMVLFISGGAVHTGHWPGWVHGGLFFLALGHLLKTVRIQHECFREATFLVLEMSGVSRPIK